MNDMWIQTPRGTLTSATAAAATVSAIPTGAFGVLHDHPLPAQLLAVQVIHGIVCITGVIEFDKPVPVRTDQTGVNTDV